MKKVEVVKNVNLQDPVSIYKLNLISGLVDELEWTDVPDYEDYKKEINNLKLKVAKISLLQDKRDKQLEHISNKLDAISKQLQNPQLRASLIAMFEEQVSRFDKCAVKNEKKRGATTKKG
jgi:hypothetical protein